MLRRFGANLILKFAQNQKYVAIILPTQCTTNEFYLCDICAQYSSWLWPIRLNDYVWSGFFLLLALCSLASHQYDVYATANMFLCEWNTQLNIEKPSRRNYVKLIEWNDDRHNQQSNSWTNKEPEQRRRRRRRQWNKNGKTVVEVEIKWSRMIVTDLLYVARYSLNKIRSLFNMYYCWRLRFYHDHPAPMAGCGCTVAEIPTCKWYYVHA